MAYNRINWENDPSTATPLNETNLNKMDKAIYDLDQEIATKADASALADKMDKNNPVGTGSFSMNRKADTIVGNGSCTEGRNCMATKSFTHAEGDNTIAAGYASHSEGVYSMASGEYSHAEGYNATASGDCAHAEGSVTVASGAGSHAEGNLTEATAVASHAEGAGTKAASQCQHAQGKYNEIDTQDIYADIVGWGTDENNRANIETLKTNGDFWVAGEITDGNGITLSDILPTDTVSGNPCVITDAFGGSCKSLSLDIEPIQSGSGTPSPDNVRAISGISSATVTRTGKNIAQLEQGTIDITTGLEVASTSRVRTQYIRVKEGDEYIASSNGWALKNGCAYDESKTFLYSGIYPDISTGKITIPQGVVYVRFVYGNSTNTDCTPSDYNYQFEFGATATPYEAYNGQTITRTYGQTVYGGSDDVTGDGATVTFGYIELDGSDDEGWVAVDSGKRVRTQIINSLVKKNPVSTNVPNIVSSQFEAITPNNSYLGRVGISVDGEGNLLVSDGTSAMVAADWKTYLSGHPLQVAYELATPTTISLASQNIDLLHGDNVITSNAKTVNASYKADVQLYIDKKLSE